MPSDISDLKNLKRLDISSNAIELLPYSLGSFAKLEFLNILNNKFMSIPTSL